MTEPNINHSTSSPSTSTPIATTVTVAPTVAAPKKSVVDDFFSALFANSSVSQPAAQVQAQSSTASFTSLAAAAAAPSQASIVNQASSNDSVSVETNSSELKIEAHENIETSLVTTTTPATTTNTGRTTTTTTLASLQQLPAAAIQAIGSSSAVHYNTSSSSSSFGGSEEDNDSSNQAHYKAEIDSLVNRSRNYPQYKYTDVDQQVVNEDNDNNNEDEDEDDNDQYDDAQSNNEEDDDNEDMEQSNYNHHHHHQGRNNGVNKRERQVLDEFDEYSLLSSKRGRRTSSPTTNRNQRNLRNVRGPRIEARDIIMSVNNRRNSGDNQDEGVGKENNHDDDNDDNQTNFSNEPAQILAIRDIDWSSVVPESRMLVRSMPKNIDKQEVMDYFCKYGTVLEVVQKYPYGFVHFENPESCAHAVQVENGKPFKDIILDLEICKRKPYFARAAERESTAAINRNYSSGQVNVFASGSHHQQVPRTVKYEADKRNNDERNYERTGRSGGYNYNSPPPAPTPAAATPYSRNSSIVPRGTDDGYRRGSSSGGVDYRGNNNNANNYNRPSYGRNDNNNQGYGGPRGGRNDNNGYGGNSRFNNNNDSYGARRNMNTQDINRGGYNNNNNNNNNNSGFNGAIGRNNYNDRNNGPVGGGAYSHYNNNNPVVDSGRNYSQYNDNNTNSYSRYNSNNSGIATYGPRHDNDINKYGSNGRIPPSAPTPVATPAPVIPSRQGNQVPLVQIIAWDNVAFGFTDYIERVFSTNNIRTASVTCPFSLNLREQLVQQLCLEGVKAIVMIDRRNETLNKVYLQVFLPSEYGQSVTFDEYSSITAIEAVTIINRTYPPAIQSQYSPVVTNQYQQQAYQQVSPTTMASVAQAPAVDLNTIASLYSAIQAPAQQPSAPAAQANIQQLLATLVSNLGAAAAAPVAPQQQQPNIAALLSTVTGGNPALAQLLTQMGNAGVGNNNTNTTSNQQQQGHLAYSPSMPNNQIDKNNTE